MEIKRITGKPKLSPSSVPIMDLFTWRTDRKSGKNLTLRDDCEPYALFLKVCEDFLQGGI